MNQSNALIHLPLGCLIDMLNTSYLTSRLATCLTSTNYNRKTAYEANFAILLWIWIV